MNVSYEVEYKAGLKFRKKKRAKSISQKSGF